MENHDHEQEEASSNRQKRQRSPSIIEAQTIKEGRVGSLLDMDLLKCPVCYDALSSPIFQCENGHIACSSCCDKLTNTCPSCTFPLRKYRCRAMEKLVEGIYVRCPNSRYGCTEKFSCGKVSAHEKECDFALCYCPAPSCNYSGVYKDLYTHYAANHCFSWSRFICGYSNGASLRISDRMIVLQESPDGPLVVVQCFEEPQGVYVTVKCVSPCAPGVGKYSYRVSYTMGGKKISFESPEMDRVQKVSFQTPDKDFMLVPYYFLDQCSTMTMKIHIGRIQEVVEEEDEQEDKE